MRCKVCSRTRIGYLFVPNSHYDGHKSYLSTVIFQYETSSSSEFSSLKTGTVNVGYLGVSLLGSRSELSGDTLTTPYTLDSIT
jgi:peptide/nickel transport system substrate-binding protein